MPRRTVIRGALLLPNDGRQALRRTDLLIEDGRIAAVGGVEPEGATIVEVKGIVVPGLIDAYRHLDLALTERGFAPDPGPRARTLVEEPAFVEGLGEEGRRQSSQVALGAALPAGVLAVGDPSGAALLDPGLALSAAVRVVSALDLSRAHHAEAELDRLSALAGQEPDGDRFQVALWAGDAERTALPRLTEAASLARRRHLPLYVRLGTRPDDRQGLARLERAGALGPELVLLHGTGRSMDDPRRVRALADAGVRLVLAPAFELLSGAPLPPIERLITQGIVCALGTHSAATRLRFELAEEARLLYRILKAKVEHPASLALEAATRGGGLAVGTKSGTLEVGQRADFLLFDLDAAPGEDHEVIARRILFHTPSRMVRAWVDGQVVWDRGRVLPFTTASATTLEQVRRQAVAKVVAAHQTGGARLHRWLDRLEVALAGSNSGWHRGQLPLSAEDPRGE
ncbi:MAG: amidohydrolase family protein [Deltaproteobacteria bacterium]|nr:amidohydrolase family protein [Deltaproteobacteria bacterium]